MAKAANVLNNTVFTPSAADTAFANNSVQTLDGLVTRRKQWEATDYKKANDGLYALLADCLALFNQQFMSADATGQKALRIELTAKLEADGVKVQKTTPTLTMFVRYVFGSDRKRAHGYAYVLKAAISHGVAAKDLAGYIVQEGGIEEVKRKMVVSEESLAKRAVLEAAKIAVKSGVEVASTAPLAQVALAGVTGEYAVLIARPTPDGMVSIVGVLSEAKDTLVEALFAQMAKRKVNDDETTAALDKETTDLFGASAEAANAPVVAKQA
jgi:hypothetical protein